MSTTDENAILDKQGAVKVPAKLLGAIVAAITIPLIVMAFQDLRASAREASIRAEHASVAAANALSKAESITEQLGALRNDVREIRALILSTRR